jgi:deoxyadenosine/deoxycytidine kinase
MASNQFTLEIPDDSFCDDGFKIPFESRKKGYYLLKKYVERGTFSRYFSGKSGKSSTYISVEGSIGVGKTHLARSIHKHLEQTCTDSPVYLIEERVNLEWLNAFINDPVNRAGIFQIKRLMETINAAKEMWAKLSVHREYDITGHCIGDRLPLGNFAFALVHHSMGNIDDTVFGLYGTSLADGGPYNYPDIVLLLCKPETAIGRIRSRDRKGESAYTIDYLQQLDEATLFTLLYIWYTGVLRVIPFDWGKFGNPEHVVRVAEKLSWKDLEGKEPIHSSSIKILREEIRSTLLCMSYTRMREIAYQLAALVH